MTVVDDPRTDARRFGRPPYAMMLTFPTSFFVAALATDLAYWKTANLQWSAFSSWLLLAGLMLGGLAIFFGLVECLFFRRVRSRRAAWLILLGNLITLGLATLNFFFHLRDGWTAVVPWGLALSVVTVVVLLVTLSQGWAMAYRRRVVMVAP